MAASTVSVTYMEYKENEKRFQQLLFGELKDSITAQAIITATKHAIKRSTDKFGKKDLDNLQSIIDRRHTVTKFYEAHGISCPGHAYWIRLLEGSYQALHEDWLCRQTTTKNDSKLVDLTATLNDLSLTVDDSSTSSANTEKPASVNDERPTVPSYKVTMEDVLFVSGLDNILAMGEWLRDVWEAAVWGKIDFATVGHLSNCVRQLVQQEYHAQSLLRGWSKLEVFQRHPLALQIRKAVKNTPRISEESYIPSNTLFDCPLLESVYTKTSPQHQDSRQLDLWLLDITEKEWSAEHTEADAIGVGYARRSLLIKALRIQLAHLHSDMPNHRMSDTIGSDWPEKTALMISSAENQVLPPIWAFFDLAAQIAGKRHALQWYCSLTLAKERMLDGLEDKPTDAVFDWLYTRWGLQTWPEGKPKNLESAVAMMGKTSARLRHLYERSKVHAALSYVLNTRDSGLTDAISRLRQDTEWWANQTGALYILERLRLVLEEESTVTFDLDGAGWDAVAAGSPFISSSKPSSSQGYSRMKPCSLKDLKASTERQSQKKWVNRFGSEIRDGLFAKLHPFGPEVSSQVVEKYSGTIGTDLGNGSVEMVEYQYTVPAGTPLHFGNAVCITVNDTDVASQLSKGKVL